MCAVINGENLFKKHKSVLCNKAIKNENLQKILNHRGSTNSTGKILPGTFFQMNFCLSERFYRSCFPRSCRMQFSSAFCHHITRLFFPPVSHFSSFSPDPSSEISLMPIFPPTVCLSWFMCSLRQYRFSLPWFSLYSECSPEELLMFTFILTVCSRQSRHILSCASEFFHQNLY